MPVQSTGLIKSIANCFCKWSIEKPWFETVARVEHLYSCVLKYSNVWMNLRICKKSKAANIWNWTDTHQTGLNNMKSLKCLSGESRKIFYTSRLLLSLKQAQCLPIVIITSATSQRKYAAHFELLWFISKHEMIYYGCIDRRKLCVHWMHSPFHYLISI